MTSSHIPACARISGFLALALGSVLAQSKQDSGWVSLIDGKDLKAFYGYFESIGVVDPDIQDAFVLEDSIIHVPKVKPEGYTNMQGQLITRKSYSWYKLRVDYRFAPDTGSHNAGLLIHVDNQAALAGTVKALRPRSIEVNFRRAEASPWTLWSAWELGPYITTTVKSGTNQFLLKKEGGIDWTNNPWGQRTVSSTYANTEKPPGEWNRGEALVFGDSVASFYLNGQLRTQGWGFKLRGSPNDSATSKRIPCDSGGIGIQSEKFEIWYKNFEIMELEPHTLKPLHAKPTTKITGKSASQKRWKKRPLPSKAPISLNGRIIHGN